MENESFNFSKLPFFGKIFLGVILAAVAIIFIVITKAWLAEFLYYTKINPEHYACSLEKISDCADTNALIETEAVAIINAAKFHHERQHYYPGSEGGTGKLTRSLDEFWVPLIRDEWRKDEPVKVFFYTNDPEKWGIPELSKKQQEKESIKKIKIKGYVNPPEFNNFFTGKSEVKKYLGEAEFLFQPREEIKIDKNPAVIFDDEFSPKVNILRTFIGPKFLFPAFILFICAILYVSLKPAQKKK